MSVSILAKVQFLRDEIAENLRKIEFEIMTNLFTPDETKGKKIKHEIYLDILERMDEIFEGATFKE